MLAKIILHLVLHALAYGWSTATLIFKEEVQEVSLLESEQEGGSGLWKDATMSSIDAKIIRMPHRLPKLHEEILFDLPGKSSPVLLRVNRVYQHPATRSNTVIGSIIDASTTEPSGTFLLACQLTDTASSSINCLGNIKPTTSVQYELRQDTLKKSHSIRKVNTNVVYEPRVVAGDQAGHEKQVKRFSHDVMTSSQDASKFSSDERRRLAADSNDILDLFVVWTPEAEGVAGSADAMSLYMDFIVDEANYVLESSDVELRVRIVHSMRALDASYLEPGSDLGEILDQATDYASAGRPEFDTEQSMRYSYKADALVVIAGSTAGNQCGIAWLKTSNSFPVSYTVSVSALDCLSGYGTLIHELGHNLGSAHDLSASTQGEGFRSYSHGYCWDRSTAVSCDGTCGRTAMAYSGCTTALGCSGCPKYDVFSNPSVLIDGSPVGTASLNNARSLNESRKSAVALQDSQVDGGLIFSVEPNHIAVISSCFEVTVKGWYLGDGSDISSVSLAGITSTDIISQSKHHVSLNVDLTGASAMTGDVVVTSGSFSTTMENGFTFEPSHNLVVKEDFETKLDVFYQSDDSNGWYFFDTFCPTTVNGVCQYYGPASGDGMFALAVVDGSGRDAAFEGKFSTSDCVDTINAVSVKYYAFSTSSQCFSSDFLQIQLQYTAGGSWTTVGSTSSKHGSNNENWNTLSVTGLSNVIYGVKILTKTSSSIANCDYWNPVAIDDISVDFSRDCTCATLSPTITHTPTAVPSTSAPTPNITTSVDDNDDVVISMRLIIIAVVGFVAFIMIMMCFCWCDHFRAKRRERLAARRAEREREQEFTDLY